MRFASPSNVFAVPDPVITLLFALLFIVVPVIVLQVVALPEPALVNTCPDEPYAPPTPIAPELLMLNLFENVILLFAVPLAAVSNWNPL